MNDQLKHDIAVAIGFATVEIFPGYLLNKEDEAARTRFTQVIHTALNIYDHFLAEENDFETHDECDVFEECDFYEGYDFYEECDFYEWCWDVPEPM